MCLCQAAAVGLCALKTALRCELTLSLSSAKLNSFSVQGDCFGSPYVSLQACAEIIAETMSCVHAGVVFMPRTMCGRHMRADATPSPGPSNRT